MLRRCAGTPSARAGVRSRRPHPDRGGGSGRDGPSDAARLGSSLQRGGDRRTEIGPWSGQAGVAEPGANGGVEGNGFEGARSGEAWRCPLALRRFTRGGRPPLQRRGQQADRREMVTQDETDRAATASIPSEKG